MRTVHLTNIAAAVLAAVALTACGDATEATEGGEPATAEDAATDASADAADDATMPEDVMAAVEKADACRVIATEADEVGMEAVQDQWDEAGCETLGDDLNAAREANADDADAIAALDHAARPMGT